MHGVIPKIDFLIKERETSERDLSAHLSKFINFSLALNLAPKKWGKVGDAVSSQLEYQPGHAFFIKVDALVLLL